MPHTRLLSLLNIMYVAVVTHVNVKSSPTVALSDDVVSVKPATNRRLSTIIYMFVFIIFYIVNE